ncbi:cysteine--tRNA ligase [Candidatus Micrarchaeota archaeon]|nr:MAG: cysteine--tRNA ligase [Candidatus Micrarchaeota archaeon]
MSIKVFNTLGKKLESFKPLNDKKVKLFVCGPTVYDYSHIGHAKTYIAFDVIVRYLRYRGYEVEYIQNITDIDDKIIKRAQEEGENSLELSERFTKEYFKDMEAIYVDSVSKYVKATEVIDEIIKQAKALVDKGIAYVSNGSVYFSISKFPDYGKLSGRKPDKEKAKSRLEEDPNKKDPLDFVIWKAAKEGEPSWKSPWGEGRPGWHIEDTAISISNFGEQYDVHGGGEDLIFPHHEAEIAIAESYTGKKPFVKYWLHSSFLRVEGRKMSKSLGNFITIRDAVKKHGGRVLKFYFASVPYYRPIDYSDKHIEAAKKSLEKIDNLVENLMFIHEKGNIDNDSFELDLAAYREAFVKCMDNNFNTAEAVAVLFDLVRTVNQAVTDKKLRNKEKAKAILDLLKEWEKVLGFPIVIKKKEKVPDEVMKLIKEREEARRKKDWEKADRIREKIKSMGWYVEDTVEGPKPRRIK